MIGSLLGVLGLRGIVEFVLFVSASALDHFVAWILGGPEFPWGFYFLGFLPLTFLWLLRGFVCCLLCGLCASLVPSFSYGSCCCSGSHITIFGYFSIYFLEHVDGFGLGMSLLPSFLLHFLLY